MTPKPIVLAVAKLYRGVAIYTTLEGYVVYSDSGEPIPCNTEADAKKVIDDYVLAISRSMVLGEIQVQ